MKITARHKLRLLLHSQECKLPPFSASHGFRCINKTGQIPPIQITKTTYLLYQFYCRRQHLKQLLRYQVIHILSIRADLQQQIKGVRRHQQFRRLQHRKRQQTGRSGLRVQTVPVAGTNSDHPSQHGFGKVIRQLAQQGRDLRQLLPDKAFLSIQRIQKQIIPMQIGFSTNAQLLSCHAFCTPLILKR